MKDVLIGLSGGIDSAVAAAGLLEQGYRVTGCFLCLTEGSSPETADAHSAKQAAEKLGIDLIFADRKEAFRKNVTDYFTSEYLAGRTPNPCVRCNPTVKIASLIEEADRLGIETVATGHYAQISHNGFVPMLCASPSKKDQSYFLYALSDEQIARLVFPLGHFLSKEEIRAKGRELGFEAAEKPDSLEVCFIPDNDYARYICEKGGYTPRPGHFLDNDGSVIGTHAGIIRYTVGQRKGLGAFGAPRYVKAINAKDNTVTLCKKEERFASSLRAVDLVRHGDFPASPFTAKVRIRSTAAPAEALITVNGDEMRAEFTSPVLAPTPGQAAVIYDGNTVLGGGTITV